METPNDTEKLEEAKKGIWQNLKKFFLELLDIRNETDRDATIEAVQKDISFKGHNAWILIFSVFVASIGLNLGSTAVVIGAMLISPLLGPILGVGLSVAINDIDTLRRSLVNLGVMVGLSVVTAFLYFKISPLTEETPELIARTYPTILDVLIAIFGGLALIVAKTKSGTIASVIFGVAIATALMPPLCTVGYGLAVSNLKYAGGALYLFSINAVFIALSTFIIAKLLRFPMVRYANSRIRKRIAQLASLVAVIVVIPSIVLFINLLNQQVFETRVKTFIGSEVKFQGAEVVKSAQDYEAKLIEVYLIGKLVPQTVINEWNTRLQADERMQDVKLKVYQGDDQSTDLAEKLTSKVKSGILEDLYVKNETLLRDKEAQIQLLEQEVTKLRIQQVNSFEKISNELKLLYPDLMQSSYSEKITRTDAGLDSIAVFNLTWQDTLTIATKKRSTEAVRNWLRYKLELDTLLISWQ